jgi:hypothetical protein
MATTTAPNVDIREAVLRTLRENECQPMQLLTQLGQLEYTDSDIKQAVSELIREGSVELTSTRVLKIPAEPAA